ncbi:transglutaminase domain-containing protein [Candidatus Bathyarchaeota archaeon]|nr:transglutaminase domain-containing protein [Candidatus Bathyarchaeota archaeon]
MTDDLLKDLYHIVQKIGQGDIQIAQKNLLEINSSAIRKLFQRIESEKEYNIVKVIAYMMQSATLYYFTRSLEKKRQGDEISSLAYSAYAAGINAALVTAILPNLRKHASYYDNEQEIERFQKMIEYTEQEINSIMLGSTEAFSGKSQKQIKKQITETTQIMISFATKKTQEVRNLAVSLGKKFAAGDFKQARRLYEYVRDEIAYIHDPRSTEEVQPPEVTLKLGGGDCDDKAVLLASLLMSIGFDVCFFIADTDNDNNPDHVYTGVYLPDAPELYKPFQKKLLKDGKNLHDWIPLDPTYEDSDFGVIPIIDIGIVEYVPIVAYEK